MNLRRFVIIYRVVVACDNVKYQPDEYVFSVAV